MKKPAKNEGIFLRDDGADFARIYWDDTEKAWCIDYPSEIVVYLYDSFEEAAAKAMARFNEYLEKQERLTADRIKYELEED